MTTYSTDAARDALAGLLDTPDAVPLEEPLTVGSIIALAEQVRRARAERDELKARIQAALQTIEHYKADRAQRGMRPWDIVLDVEADLDPQHHPAA